MATKEQEYLAKGGTLINGRIPTEEAPTETAPGVFAPITSANLTPTPSLPYKNPNADFFSVPNISGLAQTPPTIEMTGIEKEESEINKTLRELYKASEGESAARTTAETAQGIPELTKQQNELASQLNALVNESKYIPLQMQQEAQARGITTAGLAPIQTARLRENAIKALTTSSLLEASRGNLAFAQSQVDRAVAAQFNPIKERIATEKANLELIRQSPEYSIADKNRAAQMQAVKDAQAREVARQEAETKSIKDLIIKVQPYGIPNEVLTQAQGATTFEEVQRILNPYMTDPKAKLELQKAQADLDKAILEKEAVEKNNPTALTTATNIVDVMKGGKIGATTKTNIGTIMGVINAAEDMAKESKGVFGGISPLNTLLDVKIPFTNIGIPFREALKSAEGTKNTAYINAINLKVQQWASGASLTQTQTEQVAKLVPTTSDTDAKVKEKLNSLVDIMNKQIKGALQAEGIEYNPEKVDLFAPEETLSSIFK